MKHLLDEKPVTLGQLIRVTNIEKVNDPKKYVSYNLIYMSLHVEDESGAEDTERCVLMTLSTHTDMEHVVLPTNLVNEMVYGRLYKVTIAKRNCYLVRTKHYDLDKDMVLRISPSQLNEADKRAIKLPQTCTKKSWFTDIRD